MEFVSFQKVCILPRLSDSFQGDFCRQQSWRVRNLISMFNRIVKLPHRPNEENIRKIYIHLGIPIPPGTLPASIDAIANIYMLYTPPSMPRAFSQDGSHDPMRPFGMMWDVRRHGGLIGSFRSGVVGDVSQVGYEEFGESEAETEDEVLEPEPTPKPPAVASDKCGTPSTSPRSFACIGHIYIYRYTCLALLG